MIVWDMDNKMWLRGEHREIDEQWRVRMSNNGMK
jgi:hypothetical protein